MITRGKTGIFKPKTFVGLSGDQIDWILMEPSRFSYVINYPIWKDAMNKEIESLRRNKTWELVPIFPIL